MANFRKLIAAVVGVVALFALRYFDVTVIGLDAVVLELIVSALTALGVYGLRNDPPREAAPFEGENV